ncbi:hypothetical protein [Falsirhodobacter halotolerans]|uniref:hypothetical protein n=1 Tax=Falsirhodobacter halotolerans TaxID=1146892 RepID=UPI001FD2AE35|nr:hypothetical protein [Falsirhodobacter halotolerans]MCJ8139597.1 hypothetical protein [Falsirhodobacter halotolerans]
MTDPRILARRIVTIALANRINVSTEHAAHASLAAALEAAQLPVAREVRLTTAERIDIMVEGVGVEVKIKGSRRDIYHQLERYAACEQITALVLATATAWPAHMAEIGGKPFFHASLVRGWL